MLSVLLFISKLLPCSKLVDESQAFCADRKGTILSFAVSRWVPAELTARSCFVLTLECQMLHCKHNGGSSS